MDSESRHQAGYACRNDAPSLHSREIGLGARDHRCRRSRGGCPCAYARCPVEPTRFIVSLPPGTTIGVAENRMRIAISPDGRRLAMVVQ